jgi:hypothetical protein
MLVDGDRILNNHIEKAAAVDQFYTNLIGQLCKQGKDYRSGCPWTT